MMVPTTAKGLSISKYQQSASVYRFYYGWSDRSFVVSFAIDAFEYKRMKTAMNYYAAQFTEMRSTMTMLKQAEMQFKGILSSGGKKEILENIDPKTVYADAGSIDMEELKEQLRKSAKSVASIQEYLKGQRDIFVSTPSGWPVSVP